VHYLQGRAKHVAKFYEEQLRTQTRLFSSGEGSLGDNDIKVDVAVITAGPGIHLLFRGAGNLFISFPFLMQHVLSECGLLTSIVP
jgi:hypothetical protein